MKNGEKLGIGMKTITMLPEMDKEFVKIAMQDSIYADKKSVRVGFSQNEIEL